MLKFTVLLMEHKAATTSNEKQSLGGAFYKHLMSGVSQMLPFVIGGGIMIALAFLIDGALGVPNESLGNLGSYHELSFYVHEKLVVQPLD